MTSSPVRTDDRMNDDAPKMRTKRRYAHELYPHAGEDETRPLAVEVPYLYARAIGFDIQGTRWMDRDEEGLRRSGDRTALMIAARERAFLADALLQGLSGQEAWEWAEVRNNPEGCEWIWQQAVEYGVDPDAIKPYPCGPEPDHHDHYGQPHAGGWRTVHRTEGSESSCADCCEPVPSSGCSTTGGTE